MTAAVRSGWHPRDIYHWYPEWQPKADYIGRHRKAPAHLRRVRVGLVAASAPTVDLGPAPMIGELPVRRWRLGVWVSAVLAAAAAVLGAVFASFAQSPVITDRPVVTDTLRAPQTLPGVTP